MFCIHGFPTSSWDFDPLWLPLAKHFELVAPDLIGLGMSEKKEKNINISLQADMVENLADELGVKEAHLLAHDLGDTVALELLARQMEGKNSVQWKSIIMLNGGIFSDAYKPRLIQKMMVSPFGPIVARLTTKYTFQQNMRNIFGKSHPPDQEFIDGFWKLMRSEGSIGLMPYILRYMKERTTHKDRWENVMRKGKLPMLLINGAQDPISGKHIYEQYLKEVPKPNAVLLADAGHYPHVEEPERVLDAIQVFHKF